MNRKLKTALAILGLLAAALLVSQLLLGLQIARGGATIKLIKAHQHSGYATVATSLIYVLTSLLAILRAPGKLGATA